MKPEDEIQVSQGLKAAFKAISEADRNVEAPPEVEMRLRASFRGRVQAQSSIQVGSLVPISRSRDWRMRAWQWIPAVAAAAILAIVAWHYRAPRVEPVRVASDVAPGLAPVIQRQITGTQPRIARVPAAQVTRRNAGRAPYSQPQEIATDFFPLVDFAPPVDDAELVRVSLPASAMREVGLPVREDRLDDQVQADVLVSNGMATAIRFVKNMQ